LPSPPRSQCHRGLGKPRSLSTCKEQGRGLAKPPTKPMPPGLRQAPLLEHMQRTRKGACQAPPRSQCHRGLGKPRSLSTCKEQGRGLAKPPPRSQCHRGLGKPRSLSTCKEQGRGLAKPPPTKPVPSGLRHAPQEFTVRNTSLYPLENSHRRVAEKSLQDYLPMQISTLVKVIQLPGFSSNRSGAQQAPRGGV